MGYFTQNGPYPRRTWRRTRNLTLQIYFQIKLAVKLQKTRKVAIATKVPQIILRVYLIISY